MANKNRGQQLHRLLNQLFCYLGSHSPEGPDFSLSFKIGPGHWHPMYKCRHCHVQLKWKPEGGWEVVPKPKE